MMGTNVRLPGVARGRFGGFRGRALPRVNAPRQSREHRFINQAGLVVDVQGYPHGLRVTLQGDPNQFLPGSLGNVGRFDRQVDGRLVRNRREITRVALVRRRKIRNTRRAGRRARREDSFDHRRILRGRNVDRWQGSEKHGERNARFADFETQLTSARLRSPSSLPTKDRRPHHGPD